MKLRWNFDHQVWAAGDADSTTGLISASALLVFAIFAMPVVAGKFLAHRLGMADILLFSAMPGIIGYRFFSKFSRYFHKNVAAPEASSKTKANRNIFRISSLFSHFSGNFSAQKKR